MIRADGSRLCATSGWKWFANYETRGVLDFFAAVGVTYLIVRCLDNCREALADTVQLSQHLEANAGRDVVR